MKLTNVAKKRLALLPTLALTVFIQWNVHAARKDGGCITYPGSPAGLGPVVFSHLSHGEKGAGYSCDRCHPVGSGTALNITMEDVRRGKACGACHDGRTKGPRGRATAPAAQDCSSCHMPATDIVFTLNRMDPVSFSHIRHLAADLREKTLKAAGFSCSDCHSVPFDRISNGKIGMQVPHESGGCAHCHNGQKPGSGVPTAFAATTRCLTCHKSPATEPKL